MQPLADDEVLVAVEAIGVGRDGSGAPTASAVLGEVVDSGANATAERGHRVVAGVVAPCGECGVCRRGAATVCPRARLVVALDGAVARREVAVPARWLCRLDGDLAVPGPAAVLIGGAAATAYAAFIAVGCPPGDPVIVLGAGGTARLAIDIARARGARVLVPPGPFAGDAIHIAHDGTRGSFEQAARAAGCADLPWRIIETTGTSAGRAAAAALGSPGVRYALVTGAGPSEPLDAAVLDAGATIAGIPGAHPDLLPEIAAMAVKRELDLAATVDVVDSLDDFAGLMSQCDQLGRSPVLV